MPLQLSEDQALWFRARRGHLAGPGAPDARAAARALIGAQSQQLNPSLHALSLRSADRPTASALRRRLFEDGRDLVRTWGQRETVHLVDVDDWPLLAVTRADRSPAGRHGVMPTPDEIDAARVRLEALGVATRSDFIPHLPPRLLAEAVAAIEAEPLITMPAERLAAGRFFWRLSMRGDACVGDRRGAEVEYASRRAWFPNLAWPELDLAEANVTLTRRYFALNAPARVQDVAHHFGTRVSEARNWVAALADELIDVSCGGRKGLLALAVDADALSESPPNRWPARLLPMFDTFLMAHADKSWTVPVDAEAKAIWKKAAMLAPIVVARGRAVATWSHKVKRKGLEVSVEPLSGWRKSKHAADVRRDAAELAAHLELPGVQVSLP